MSWALRNVLAATGVAAMVMASAPASWGLPLGLSKLSAAQRAEAYFEKGHKALDQKRVAAAEGDYRKAVELDPMEAKYHRQLSYLLFQTGRGQEAEREVRIAVHLDDQDWKSLVLLGKIMHSQKRFDEEVETYEQTLKILPPDEQALKDKLLAFIKADAAAKKRAVEKVKKKQEEEDRKFKNAY